MALAPKAAWAGESAGALWLFLVSCAVLGRFFTKSPDSSVRSFARHSRDVAFGAVMMVSCIDRSHNATRAHSPADLSRCADALRVCTGCQVQGLKLAGPEGFATAASWGIQLAAYSTAAFTGVQSVYCLVTKQLGYKYRRATALDLHMCTTCRAT